MASVYNSTPYVMGNNNYAYSLTQNNEYQFDNKKWEDIQGYTSVIITVSAGTPGHVKLRWANTDDDEMPELVDLVNPLAQDVYYYNGDTVKTLQFDTRSRWLNVWYDGSLDGAVDTSLTLATLYKKAPTEIKLTDDSTNIVSVNRGDVYNSLYVGLTDMSGTLINTTLESQTGEALYVHLADGSGSSLDTTNSYRNIERADNSLFVFTNDVNGSSASVFVNKNEFIMKTDTLPARDNDIVFFTVAPSSNLNNGIDLNNVLTSFVGDELSPLTAQARMKFISSDPSFTRFQLMVDQNIGQWFTGDISAAGYPNIGNYQDMPVELKQFVTEVDGHYRLLTHGQDHVAATVNDYYSIFYSVSGFSVQTNGNRELLQLNPGRYPLDLRLYQGTYHSNINQFVTALFPVTEVNKLESLAVAVRDASNHSLGSTGLNQDTYLFRDDKCNPEYHRVLFLVDTYTYAPDKEVGQTNYESNIVPAIVKSLTQEIDPSSFVHKYNELTSYPEPINTTDTGSVYAVIGYSDLSVNGQYALPPNLTPTILRSIVATNYDDLSRPWQAAYQSLPLIDSCGFTDVVFVMGSTSGFSETDNQFKDLLDTCLDTWNGVRRYVIAPHGVSGEIDMTDQIPLNELTNSVENGGQSLDLLQLVNGHTDHIFYYHIGQLPGLGTPASNLIFSNYLSQLEPLIKEIYHVKHEANNALMVHTTSKLGTSQAGTDLVQEAAFGDVALYYSLSDASGLTIGTTKVNADTSNNNAMFVHLNLRDPEKPNCGKSVSEHNPLPVEFQGEILDGMTFDLTVSGGLTTTTDLSNNRINLLSVNFVNEGPTTVWVKLYDVSYGFVDTNVVDPVVDLQSHLIYNLAVPGLNTRDIPFARPISVSYGLHFLASTNFKYDSSLYPPGNKNIYVNGSYKYSTN